MLRPIGTTFEVEYPPLINETGKPYFKVITYKVIKYKKAMRFLGDKEGHIVEELDVVKIKEIPAKCVIINGIVKYEKENNYANTI